MGCKVAKSNPQTCIDVVIDSNLSKPPSTSSISSKPTPNIRKDRTQYLECSDKANLYLTYKSADPIATQIFDAELPVTSQMIIDRQSEPFYIEKYPLDMYKRNIIQLLTVKRNVIHKLCPIQTDSNTPNVYDKDPSIDTASICQTCNFPFQQHSKPQVIEQSVCIAARVYHCELCKRVPKDMILTIYEKQTPIRLPEKISKTLPPSQNDRYICRECYIKLYRDSPKIIRTEQ